MTKNYQTTTAPDMIDETLAMPAEVTVALAEIGGAAREGLLALAVATGLEVMGAMMEESVCALAGPKGRHDPDRTAVRHGSEDGSVVLGGRRVPVGNVNPDWPHPAHLIWPHLSGGVGGWRGAGMTRCRSR